GVGEFQFGIGGVEMGHYRSADLVKFLGGDNALAHQNFQKGQYVDFVLNHGFGNIEVPDQTWDKGVFGRILHHACLPKSAMEWVVHPPSNVKHLFAEDTWLSNSCFTTPADNRLPLLPSGP